MTILQFFLSGISDTGRFQCNRRGGGSSGGRTSPALRRPAALHVWDSTTRPVLPAAEHQGRSRADFNLHQNVIEEIQWCTLKNVGLLQKTVSVSSPPTLCLTLLCLQLQQTVEEKSACAAQLRAVSQTLRDTQNRCHWLENQVQVQAQVKNDTLLWTHFYSLVLSKYKTVLYILRIGKTSVMSDVTTANLK